MVGREDEEGKLRGVVRGGNGKECAGKGLEILNGSSIMHKTAPYIDTASSKHGAILKLRHDKVTGMRPYGMGLPLLAQWTWHV